MRPLLTAIATTTAAIGLAWPSGATPLNRADAASVPHSQTRLGILGCRVPVPDLPPKDLSKLPGIDCR
jgi:hypothetical protein